MKNLAIVVFAIGVILTLYSGFNLVTKEKVVDVGSIEITRDKNNYVSWSPIMGVVAMVAGAGMFFMGAKSN